MLKRVLFTLSFLLLAPSVYAQQPGYFVAPDCGLVTPAANATACLQTATANGRTAGKLYIWSGATWLDAGTGPTGPIGPTGPAGGLTTVKDEGSSLTQRDTINFTGAGITCVDNAGATRTDCTIPGGTGYTEVDDEGSALTTRSALNVVGRGIIADDSGAKTRIRVEDPTTMIFVKDEFLAHLFVNSGPPFNFASAGLGSGSVTPQAAVAGRNGVLRISTDSVANDIEVFDQITTIMPIHTSDTFDILFIAKRVQDDANATTRMGLFNAGGTTSDPPTSGIYFERLAGDTQWFCVSRSASTQTRSTAVASSDTNWHRFRLRRVDGSTIGCSIDGGTEQTNTTNIPSVATKMVMQEKTTAAAAKSLDIDYVDLLITGLTR